jgi:hypothetical protein
MIHQANKITIKSPDESGAKIIRFRRQKQPNLIFLEIISCQVQTHTKSIRYTPYLQIDRCSIGKPQRFMLQYNFAFSFTVAFPASAAAHTPGLMRQ